MQIRQIRQRLGYTQQQMAELLAVSFASINRWEGGTPVNIGLCKQVYRALDLIQRTGKFETLAEALEVDGHFQKLTGIFVLAHAAVAQ